MSNKLPTRKAVETVREFAERELPVEEFLAAISAPISESERESTRELVQWFRRRYPTPAERLAYVRRAYTRWTRNTAA